MARDKKPTAPKNPAFERLHRRDAKGRFTKSFTRTTTAAEAGRARATVEAFQDAKFASPANAMNVLRRMAGDGSGLREYHADWRATHEQLRAGHTTPAAAALDADMRPTTQDLTLARQVPISMFSHRADTDLADLQGLKVHDAAPQSTSGLGGEPAREGMVNMTIAAPEGTRAVVDPTTGEVVLAAGTDLVVTSAKRNGSGGWDVSAVVLPRDEQTPAPAGPSTGRQFGSPADHARDQARREVADSAYHVSNNIVAGLIVTGSVGDALRSDVDRLVDAGYLRRDGDGSYALTDEGRVAMPAAVREGENLRTRRAAAAGPPAAVEPSPADSHGPRPKTLAAPLTWEDLGKPQGPSPVGQVIGHEGGTYERLPGEPRRYRVTSADGRDISGQVRGGRNQTADDARTALRMDAFERKQAATRARARISDNTDRLGNGTLGSDEFTRDNLFELAEGATADDLLAAMPEISSIDPDVARAYVQELVDLHNARTGANLPGPTPPRSAPAPRVSDADVAAYEKLGRPALLKLARSVDINPRGKSDNDLAKALAGIDEQNRLKREGRLSTSPASSPGLSSAEVHRQKVDAAKADIISALTRLESGTGGWVSLERLRNHLGEQHNRRVVDEALKSLQREDSHFTLVPESVQSSLSQAQRDAAVHIGDQAKHLASLHEAHPSRAGQPRRPRRQVQRTGADDQALMHRYGLDYQGYLDDQERATDTGGDLTAIRNFDLGPTPFSRRYFEQRDRGQITDRLRALAAEIAAGGEDQPIGFSTLQPSQVLSRLADDVEAGKTDRDTAVGVVGQLASGAGGFAGFGGEDRGIVQSLARALRDIRGDEPVRGAQVDRASRPSRPRGVKTSDLGPVDRTSLEDVRGAGVFSTDPEVRAAAARHIDTERAARERSDAALAASRQADAASAAAQEARTAMEARAAAARSAQAEHQIGLFDRAFARSEVSDEQLALVDLAGDWQVGAGNGNGGGQVDRLPADPGIASAAARLESPTVPTPAPAPVDRTDRIEPLDKARIRNAVQDQAGRYFGGPMNLGESDAARYVTEGHLGDMIRKYDLGTVWDQVAKEINSDRSVLQNRESGAAALRKTTSDAASKRARELFDGGEPEAALAAVNAAEQVDPDWRSTPGFNSWGDLREVIQRNIDMGTAPKRAAPAASSGPDGLSRLDADVADRPGQGGAIQQGNAETRQKIANARSVAAANGGEPVEARALAAGDSVLLPAPDGAAVAGEVELVRRNGQVQLAGGSVLRPSDPVVRVPNEASRARAGYNAAQQQVAQTGANASGNPYMKLSAYQGLTDDDWQGLSETDRGNARAVLQQLARDNAGLEAGRNAEAILARLDGPAPAPRRAKGVEGLSDEKIANGITMNGTDSRVGRALLAEQQRRAAGRTSASAGTSTPAAPAAASPPKAPALRAARSDERIAAIAAAEAELAQARAALAGLDPTPGTSRMRGTQHGQRVDANVRRAAQLAERVQRAERGLAALQARPETGVPDLSSIRPGGFVRTRFGWHEVVKVNQSTVKVKAAPGMDDLIKKSKIEEVRPGAGAAAAGKPTPQQTWDRVQAAGSDAQARSALDGLTIGELLQVAEHGGVVWSRSWRKQQLVDKIVRSGYGRLAQSRAIERMTRL